MAVINIDNRPFCSHGSHTCSGRFCSGFDLRKPHRFVAESMAISGGGDETEILCVCGRRYMDSVHKAGSNQ